MTTKNKEEKNTPIPLDVDMNGIIDAELSSTGLDIPPGTYPAVLIAFSNPRKIKGSDKYGGEEKPMMDAVFAIVTKGGAVERIEALVGLPQNGEVNRKSRLAKLLAAVANGDEKMMKEGTIAKGKKLKDFLARPLQLVVEKKEGNDFVQVTSFANFVEGLKIPAKKDWEKLLTEDAPF